MPTWMTESVLVALVGLSGVIAGQVTSRASQRETARLSVLEATVKALQQRVDDLEEALRRAEDARAAEASRAVEAERRQWHAVQYARELLAWGRGLVGLVPDGVVVEGEPEPPETIREIL